MHEHERERDHEREALRHDSGDHGTPGRASASAQLVRSAHPVASGLIMRKAAGTTGISEDATQSLDRAANSNSQALPDDLRGRFEGSLGTDLSSVRVHTGAESAAAAESVGARAYTVGNDIHFGANEYDPSSSGGQQLIAHEVAHTVQQRGGAPTRQNKLAVSQAGDAFEGEADRAADAMVVGAPATVSGAGAGTLARKEAASMKPGAGKPEPKRDSDKASVPEQSVDIKLFGRSGTIKCTEAGVSGNLALTKLPPKETELFKMDKQWPIQLAAGGGVIVAVKGEIKATAAASITASGGVKDFGGPREETRGYEGTLTGKGSMGITATGRVEVLGYFGAAFANINAGGYVELSASVNASLSGAGTFEAYPGGELGGSATSEFGTDVTVKGTGGITIGWEALVASGKFYEVELVSRDFLTGKLGKKSTYDFATGASSTTETSEALKWKPINFSEPKLLKNKIGDKAKKAVQNIVDNEKKKNGNDIEGQQCVPREEDKKTSTEATDCDPENASCEE